MTRIAILIASALINAATIPAIASECTSSKDIAGFRARWAMVRSQPAHGADNDINCRAYAASFYESVKLRQAAAICARDIGNAHNLTVLDSEVDAFNNLLATKCAG